MAPVGCSADVVHPSENEVIALVEGSASPADAERVRAHCTQCESCLSLVAELSRQYSKEVATVGDSTPPAKPDAELEAGSTVGRYVVLERVGAGAMGVVYSARDPVLGRTVALKVLRQTTAEHQTQLVREARTLARLNHPHVSAVYDAGTDVGPWLAMEFIEGTSLRTVLHASNPDPASVMRLFRQAGEGLAAAHALGIVHCDFKPDNVMVTKTGRAVVTDFGLANATTTLLADHESLSVEGDEMLATRRHRLLGTPAYMAPEQFAGQLADARSDQFGFCVSLHEALTGSRPFVGTTLRELTDSLRTNNRVTAALRAPTARAGRLVKALLAKGLSFDPADRYSSMRALLVDLDNALKPPSARRWWPAAALVGLATVAATVFVTSRQRCAHAGDAVDQVWSFAQRDRLAAALQKSGLPGSEQVLARLRQRLDTWADDWRAAEVDVCQASYSQREAEAVTVARLACLDRQRLVQAALLDVYSNATTSLSGDLEATLPDAHGPTQQCGSSAVVSAGLVTPPDEASRPVVSALEPEIARANALFLAGEYENAQRLAEALTAKVDGVGYAPLAARQRFVLAQAARVRGRAELAQTSYLDCLRFAVEVSDRTTTAQCAMWLMHFESITQNNRSASLVAESVAQGALGELNDPRLEALFLLRRGSVAAHEGRHADAEALLRRSAELYAKALGPDSREEASALVNLGSELFFLNRLDDADRVMTQALALMERRLSSTHPDVGTQLNNLLPLYASTGRVDRARAVGEQALAIRKGAYGPDADPVFETEVNLAAVDMQEGHLAQAEARLRSVLERFERSGHNAHVRFNANLNYGLALRMQGRAAESVPSLERALTLSKEFGALETANAAFELAKALAAQPSTTARARELVKSARDAWAAAGHFDDEVKEADEILARLAAK